MISLQKNRTHNENLNAFLLEAQKQESMLTLVIFFLTVLEVLITEIRQEKDKMHEIRKKEVELSLFGNDIILH